VSQALLAHWYIGGGYMDGSEVVMIVAKYSHFRNIHVAASNVPTRQ